MTARLSLRAITAPLMAGLLAGSAMLVAATPAYADPLVQYDFTGQPGDEASVAASNTANGLAAFLFTRSANLSPSRGNDSINSSGFDDPNTFYSFGFDVAAGMSAIVNQISLGTRSSNTGPGSLDLLASVDGGAFTPLASFSQSGTATNNRTLNFGSLTALSSVVFHIAPSAGSPSANGGTIGSSGTFRVQNLNSSTPFAILGNVGAIAAAVPEPATWAMMVLGFGLIGGALRRRVAVRFA